MPEHPPSGASHGPGASGFPSPPTEFPGAQGGPPPWPSAPPRGLSRWPTFLALAIAVIATGLAIVGWFRPTPPPPAPHPAEPTYTQQQISDAKARACKAFEVVQKGVRLQTGAGNPSPESGDNAAMIEAQAANARLSVLGGAWYLRDHLDPAAPSEIATTVRRLSDSMSDLGEKYVAGAKNDDPEVANLRSDGSSLAAQITEMCK